MPIQDYQPSEFEPRWLTKEQIADPLRVVDDLFSYGHLPEVREKLWEWLRLTVTGSFHREEWDERVNILYLYEKICKLIEAAHILHRQRESGKFENEISPLA